MRKVGVGVGVMGLGVLKLSLFLRELMQQSNINVESLNTIRSIRILKEDLCYAAADFEAELTKNTRSSSRAVGGRRFTLSKERFQTGEILFQPQLAGVRTLGLHQAVALCMDHCHSAELRSDDSLSKTVVLAGGTARLEKELH